MRDLSIGAGGYVLSAVWSEGGRFCFRNYAADIDHQHLALQGLEDAYRRQLRRKDCRHGLEGRYCWRTGVPSNVSAKTAGLPSCSRHYVF